MRRCCMKSIQLLTLIDVFRYLGPTNLPFSPRIFASGTHSRFLWPSLTCSVLSVWTMFVGGRYETWTGSIHRSAELVVALLLEIPPWFSHGCRGTVLHHRQEISRELTFENLLSSPSYPHLHRVLPPPPPCCQCSGVCKPSFTSEQTQTSPRLQIPFET